MWSYYYISSDVKNYEHYFIKLRARVCETESSCSWHGFMRSILDGEVGPHKETYFLLLFQIVADLRIQTHTAHINLYNCAHTPLYGAHVEEN